MANKYIFAQKYFINTFLHTIIG